MKGWFVKTHLVLSHSILLGLQECTIHTLPYKKLICTLHIPAIYNSYLPVIGVHEMHGRMHPNYWQITILLVVDLCSSLAYFMMTQPLPIASKLPIKTLVARQLPTNKYCTLHVGACDFLATLMKVSNLHYVHIT